MTAFLDMAFYIDEEEKSLENGTGSQLTLEQL